MVKSNIDLIPEENKHGNCYVDAFRYFHRERHSNGDLRLVHGLPTGQGEISGMVYSHAWCEDNGFVYDNSSIFPKDLYYPIGKIEVKYSYCFMEVVQNMVETENFGPWEKQLIDNPY